MDQREQQHRIGVIASLLALAFAAIGLRLADLQLLRRSFLMAKAEHQQLRAVPVLGRRGSIYDRNHDLLAGSVDTESVFVSNRMAQKDDKAALVSALASTLSLSASELRRKLASGKSFYAKRSVKIETTSRLRARKFAALSFEPESKREYLQGRLAGHVLGFTSIDGHGLEGVEKYYDKQLGGVPGKKELVVDARGKVIPSETSWITRPKDGENLVLTIDGQFQHIAERELEKAYKKYSAKSASMVVMDPNTGEILALANFPDYDPNDATHASESCKRNRAVVDAYEPGSTFKAVTAALAIEQGVVDVDTPVNCHWGKCDFFGRTVRDHGDDHLGIVPFHQVIAQSSNVGTVEVALKLGPEKLYQGIQRFGFGKATGIDLPGEATGLLRPLDKWTKASMASIPYGQELSCNLLHIARVYAAIGNGGKLVTPHVVMSAKTAWGTTVIGSTVRSKLLGILEEVVDTGTGSTTALPGFKVAGKTGTAQKYNAATHSYSQTANYSSFIGFVPAEKPEFLCIVMLDDPRGMTLGGWTAGPVFRASMSAMLASRGRMPDAKVLQAAADRPATKATRWTAALSKGQAAAELKFIQVPKLIGMPAASAKLALSKADLKARIVGSIGPKAIVASQFPESGQKVRQFSTVKILLDTPKPKASEPKKFALAPKPKPKGGVD